MAKYQGDQLSMFDDELPGQSQPTDSKVEFHTPDYSLFREESQESWREICDRENPAFLLSRFPGLPNYSGFPYWLLCLLRNTVLLPRGDFQIPIVASYLSLPSAVCRRLPVLFSHGSSGSGKSTIAELAARIHATSLLGANSTLAGLRNHIQMSRFVGDRERHCCLVWDDVNKEIILANNQGILSLLKNGVERGAKITMAGGEAGQNIDFEIFAPKITSSIHAIYAIPQAREMIRRMIVVSHKPAQHWLVDDYSVFYDGISPVDLEDISSLSWEGINPEFNGFWNVENLTRFSSVAKKLNSTRSHDIEKPLYAMSKDLIATGVVCGYWANIDAALAHLTEYWKWHKENIEAEASNLQKVLKRFIDTSVRSIDEMNQKAIENNCPALIRAAEIVPAQLKNYYLHCLSQGELEPGTREGDVKEAMTSLGWKLTQNKDEKSMWMRIHS